MIVTVHNHSKLVFSIRKLLLKSESISCRYKVYMYTVSAFAETNSSYSAVSVNATAYSSFSKSACQQVVHNSQ